MEFKITTKKLISPKHGWGLGNEYTISIGGEELGKFTFTELTSFLQIIDESNRGKLPTMTKEELKEQLSRCKLSKN